ncbi:MAG TPA: PfkB family carbohydrate kinase [Candidatus Omnitrophota bacterium]|nr:PfkB family carbohydrate kinase [Candidatus Omnitrophota bacterium]
MSIIVLGTVALDTVKTPHGQRRHMLGGSAVHFSMSCRLFTDVHLVAIIGGDFPARHVDFLHRKGLVLTSLLRSKGKTFRWEGEYQGDLNSALTRNTELGVLLSFSPMVSESQRRIKNIFLANVDPDIQSRLLDSMHAPHLVGLDSMNYWIHNKRASLVRLFKRVDVYVANDQEARDLTGEHNLIKAARRLRALGPRIVLIKKGEHGVILSCDKFQFCLPAYPTAAVVDPTGAGDTFAGGFMGYLCSKPLTEVNLKKAIAYGTIAASFNVEGFGLERTSRLTLAQVNKRLQEFKKILRF